MSFNPGPDWVQVPGDPVIDEAIIYRKHGQAPIYWVPVAPLVLPTEPYTVIKVTMKPGYEGLAEKYILDEAFRWRSIYTTSMFKPEDMELFVADYEVLSEPFYDYASHRERIEQETAKKILDMLPFQSKEHNHDVDQNAVRSRFGVK